MMIITTIAFPFFAASKHVHCEKILFYSQIAKKETRKINEKGGYGWVMDEAH